jgi:RNA polymerase sigma factor (sigma-70 family)
MRYARDGNAEAFAALVREYSGMVYATCLRVTKNGHDAEDAAQKGFLELARKAQSITSSVSGWLHAAATNHARSVIRANAARRVREQAVLAEPPSGDASAWEEVAPCVDEALESLPDELRVPLVLHYLQGKNQTQVAAELGVDQSTVSRRLDKGLEELRDRLKKAGEIAPVALLAALLTEHASIAAPAALLAALGRMALAGVGQSAAIAATGAAVTQGYSVGSAAAGLFTTMAGKVAAIAVAGAIVATGAVVYRKLAEQPRGATVHISHVEEVRRNGAFPQSPSPNQGTARPVVNIARYPDHTESKPETNTPLQEFLSQIAVSEFPTNGLSEQDLLLLTKFVTGLSSLSTNRFGKRELWALTNWLAKAETATPVLPESPSNGLATAEEQSALVRDAQRIGSQMGANMTAAFTFITNYPAGPPPEGTPEWGDYARTVKSFMSNTSEMVKEAKPVFDRMKEPAIATAFQLSFLQSTLRLGEDQVGSISNIVAQTYGLSGRWGLFKGQKSPFTPEAIKVLRGMASSNAFDRIAERLNPEQRVNFVKMFSHDILFEQRILVPFSHRRQPSPATPK